METFAKPRLGLYRPLAYEKREIRLLHIEKDFLDTTPIRCSLRTVSLDDAPAYDCISYMWGDQGATTPIQIDGFGILVTGNLVAGLLRFRRRDRSEHTQSWLWADAIRIDQAKLIERARQVAMMADIFVNAQCVRV